VSFYSIAFIRHANNEKSRECTRRDNFRRQAADGVAVAEYQGWARHSGVPRACGTQLELRFGREWGMFKRRGGPGVTRASQGTVSEGCRVWCQSLMVNSHCACCCKCLFVKLIGPPLSME
jgi:hypothetical protein